jgi:hypothetical protein
MIDKKSMATKNSPAKFKESLQESFLELLWRQWRTLGIAAHGPETTRLIDLEALILATAVVAEQDRRVWTAVIQWLTCFREWISWARLKRMAAPFIKPDELLKRPLIKKEIWEELCHVLYPVVSAGKAIKNNPKADRTLTPPRLKKPPLLQLLLRGIFGVNARAELILYLMVKGEGNSNQIAREIHYDQKNIYLILERWTESGFVSRENRGKQNLYALKPGNEFPLNVKIPTAFWRWEPFFRSFGRLFVAVNNEPWRADPYLLSSLFRDMQESISVHAKIAGIVLPEPQLYPGEELFEPMAKALQNIPDHF